MPCQPVPLRLLEHSKKMRGPMESRGFLIELGWVGRSGNRSKQVVLRFNPRSRPTSAEPTCVSYAFRDSGAEDLLMSERLPQDELIAEEDPIAFLQKTLLRHSKKDEFCRKLFDAYWKDLALQTEAEKEAEAGAESDTEIDAQTEAK
jgi:hypothetical protein